MAVKIDSYLNSYHICVHLMSVHNMSKHDMSFFLRMMFGHENDRSTDEMLEYLQTTGSNYLEWLRTIDCFVNEAKEGISNVLIEDCDHRYPELNSPVMKRLMYFLEEKYHVDLIFMGNLVHHYPSLDTFHVSASYMCGKDLNDTEYNEWLAIMTSAAGTTDSAGLAAFLSLGFGDRRLPTAIEYKRFCDTDCLMTELV